MTTSRKPQSEGIITVAEDGPDASEHAQPAVGQPWQVLVVDDEAGVHHATAFALEGVTANGRGIAFLHAYGERDARAILADHDDIAVILLDVVMEAEDSGLRLVRFVREELHQQAVRIVLYTGQPGYAPEMQVIQEYDINDYKVKTELTRSRLAATMIAAIRSYDQIRTIEASSRSLERIVEGASDLFARRGLDNLCDALLTHSRRLFGDYADGFVCLPNHAAIDGTSQDELGIAAAAGAYQRFLGKSLSDIDDAKAVAAVHDVLGGGANRYGARSMTLLLRDSSHASLVVHLHTRAALTELNRRLVEVFCANGSVAFENVRLIERLRTHAYTDQLTGLANRTKFVNVVDERILVGRDSWVVAIVDVNQFSETNDALGHGCGDQLLKAIGARLDKSRGPDVTLARVAGDSFGVFGPQDQVDPKKILALFAKPHKVGAYSLHVSVSIGLVRLNETRGSGLDALKNASIGLNRAKSRKQGSYCFFTHAMEAETQERVRLALGLRRSIRTQQLMLHYQPQIELATGRVLGAEALLRWRNSDGSFVPPEKFIPVAESSGLIRPIGAWVLRSAARQLRSWCDRWPGEFRLAVNVSIDQFRIPDFSDQVRSVIDEFGLEPRRLELEITESVAMDDMEIVLGTLRKLKDIGVSIAIDDFGTGFSSLGYLQKLSVDRLKIDRSFVNGMNVSAGAGAGEEQHRVSCIPEMIVRLGHNLDLQVVAEGVETDEQARLLRQFGCDEAQGYLYSRPLTAEALEQWIDERGISGQSGALDHSNAT